jgi:hypothetical protein
MDNFKWYRKLRGGTWFLVKTEYPRQLNISGPVYPYWTRFTTEHDKVIKTEVYK